MSSSTRTVRYGFTSPSATSNRLCAGRPNSLLSTTKAANYLMNTLQELSLLTVPEPRGSLKLLLPTLAAFKRLPALTWAPDRSQPIWLALANATFFLQTPGDSCNPNTMIFGITVELRPGCKKWCRGATANSMLFNFHVRGKSCRIEKGEEAVGGKTSWDWRYYCPEVG